jgi:cellulose synthase operon protein C
MKREPSLLRTLFAVCFVMFAFSGRSTAQSQDSSGVLRPVRQQEIDRLKRQIDDDTLSGVEAITDYHTETGDLNNRLDSLRYGGRLNLKFGSSSVFQFSGTRTSYMPTTGVLDQQGTNFTAGVHSKISEGIDGHFEAGATRFSTDTTSINALATLTYNPSDKGRVYVTASRSNVEESLLSMTGTRPGTGPFAGQLVGRVMENRFVAGTSLRLDRGFDVFGEGGAGTRAGSNVPSNFFKTIGGGVGYGVLSRSDDQLLSLVRAAYELNYFGFNDNRSGFSGATVGGYFSPNNFLSNIFRVEVKGAYGANLSYSASAFFGSQNYTGSPARLAKGLSGTATMALTERVSLPVTYVIDNFGPFRQQTLLARLAVKF